jgi:proteasome lid subunit RPN8/RPN11
VTRHARRAGQGLPSPSVDAAGLSLPAAFARRLLEHARRGLPNEACALLSGDAGGGRVRAVHLARNRLASPYRYEIDPDDVVRIVHRIERRGDALVGIFHSHPSGPALPSATDVREARYRVIHLLAGADGDARGLRAWRIEDGRTFEVPLAIG